MTNKMRYYKTIRGRGIMTTCGEVDNNPKSITYEGSDCYKRISKIEYILRKARFDVVTFYYRTFRGAVTFNVESAESGNPIQRNFIDVVKRHLNKDR